MQELGKFYLKVSVISNGLDKYTINNKLIFIDNFQFLSSSIASVVKNLNKDNFRYLSQKFDNNVLDVVMEKGFYPYEYIPILSSLKKNYLAKKCFKFF